MDTIVCSTCMEEKSVSNFYVREVKNSVPKYRTKCKSCYNVRVKKYADDNTNKIRDTKKIYYQENKEKIDTQNKIWFQENPDKKKDIQKRYYENNVDVILEKGRESYSQDIEQGRAKSQKYRKNNKEKIKIKRTAIAKIKRKNDLSFKLKSDISRAIRGALKKMGNSKNGITFIKYIPYTIQELKEHLEKQFEPWMTWDNHGTYDIETWDEDDQSTWTWQLDHIIPQSDLPYTSMEDDNFKKCWSLDNLRPLSAKQNYLDGMRRTRHKGTYNAM